MKFPKPWTFEPSGPGEYIVYDANNRKLFYVVGDEGDIDIEPSVLFHGAEHDALVEEIIQCLTSKS